MPDWTPAPWLIAGYEQLCAHSATSSGLQTGFPDEIAFAAGWITADDLRNRAAKFKRIFSVNTFLRLSANLNEASAGTSDGNLYLAKSEPNSYTPDGLLCQELRDMQRMNA